jgi:hypothetical protein
MQKDSYIQQLKNWFNDYVKTFYSDDAQTNHNIELKLKHTYRVCLEMDRLVEHLKLEPKLQKLAAISALFHDLGRFEQYARYKTFVDKVSENHARLGIKVINKLNLLKKLPDNEAQMVIDAIENHNKAEVSADLKPDTLLLARMLRDADKLDIWRVVTEYYRQAHIKRNPSLELDLPDNDEVSEAVLNDIMAGRNVRNTELRSLNDFKLLQMAWVFDLNFDYSIEQLRNRGYLNIIKDAIRSKIHADMVMNRIDKYISNRLR